MMLFSNKDLKKLIVPLVIEQILIIMVGFADTVMIAGVGEAAVSGVSLVDTVNVLIINIFTALATGGAVVAGHYLGQKNEKEACRSAWQLIWFSFLSSIIVTIVFIGLHQVILTTVFGQISADVMSNAKIYLIITALSTVPLAIYNAGAALFRAMGDSKTTMWISLAMNIINVVGNAILIFGFNMGVAGAAIATTFSRIVAAVVIFTMLMQKKRIINIAGQLTFRIHKNMTKRILFIGIPNSLENSMFQLGKILLLSLTSTFGTYAIAANAVSNTVAMFNILPGIAINFAMLSVAAVCVGAGEFEQAKYYTKKLMKLIYICMISISIVLYVGTPLILKIYNLSSETTKIATEVIRYHAIMAAFLWAPSFSLPNTLRAAGDVVYTMVIAVASMWIFRIGAAYILSCYFDMGVLGIWVAMTIDWGVRAILYVIRYKREKWVKTPSV